MHWVQDRKHWWNMNTATKFRERMFKNTTLVTLLILFSDVFLLSSFYVFSFVCLFLSFFLSLLLVYFSYIPALSLHLALWLLYPDTSNIEIYMNYF